MGVHEQSVIVQGPDDEISVDASLWTATDQGGWVTFSTRRFPVPISVRFAVAATGRLVPVELRLSHDEGITVGLLRKLPLGRLEAMANTGGTAETIRRALSGQGATDKGYVREVRPRTGTPAWPVDARLDVPSARPYPDSFYEQVSNVYIQLVMAGKPPAPAIAEANDVLVTRAHGWVREARKRGFLPTATPGKMG